MTCLHGLPSVMCAICNHRVRDEAIFIPHAGDETPHRLHGIWQGTGEHFPTPAHDIMRLAHAACDTSPYIHTPLSEWGKANMLRSMLDMVACIKMTPAIQALASLPPPTNFIPVVQPIAYQRTAGARWVKPGSNWTSPIQDREVTRQAPAHRWLIKPTAPTIAHAKDAGRTARRMSARTRI